MKTVKLQITMIVPESYPLNDSDDILHFLIDYFGPCEGGCGVYMDGKVIE